MARCKFDDPDLIMADLFGRWPESAGAFLDRNMHCPGCPIAPFHTVIDACQEYELDEAAFRTDIRNRIERHERGAVTVVSGWRKTK